VLLLLPLCVYLFAIVVVFWVEVRLISSIVFEDPQTLFYLQNLSF
jgi:hypothetical protein